MILKGNRVMLLCCHSHIGLRLKYLKVPKTWFLMRGWGGYLFSSFLWGFVILLRKDRVFKKLQMSPKTKNRKGRNREIIQNESYPST